MMSRKTETLQWQLLARLNKLFDAYQLAEIWKIEYMPDGYGEMRICFRNEAANAQAVAYVGIRENDTVSTLLNQIVEQLEQYINNETAQYLLAKVFDRYSVPAVCEDKQAICDALCQAYQLTRGASDLQSLDYDRRTDTVQAVFEAGSKPINVNLDSGTALIKDVAQHIGC